jgi:hypothetical protein
MTITDASSYVGVTRQAVYVAAERDPGFAFAVQNAVLQSTDLLEREARRRAVDGVRRQKFYKGKPILDPQTGEPYHERQHSDQVLMFLLRHRKPEVFGNHATVDRDVTLRTAAEGVAAADRLLAELRETLGVRRCSRSTTT